MLNNSSVLSSMTFLRNRSYTTQLLSVFNANGQNLDKNIQTEVVYLDLVKAFDCVDLQVMLQKLKRYGAEGGTLLWITDYLSRRPQMVILESVVKQSAPVVSGVPQGSLWD